LNIEIPYVADAAPKYDGLGLESFPIRHGYPRANPPLLRLAELLGYPAQKPAAFVQSWLYFGLLRDVLGDKIWDKAEKQQQFVTTARDSAGRKLLTSGPLIPLLKQKERTLTSWINDTKYERDRIRKTLRFAAKQCQALDGNCEISSWPEIMLSIRVLIDSLTHLSYHSSESQWYHRHDDGSSGPNASSRSSVQLIHDRLKGRYGWCIHQVKRMCRQTHSAIGLAYLASIRRHPTSWIDHRQCDEAEYCTANNISETFKGVHVEMNCQCAHVTAPEKDMHDILENGGFPIVSCKIDCSGNPTLQYHRATLKSSYTAISHLWADGLANLNGNSLPRCQLKRLVKRVAEVRKSTTFAGDLWHRMPWNRRVDFWLDVYCVPVPKSHNTSAIGRARDTEELHKLKAVALKKMTATYAWAKTVLVLDHELSYITSAHDELELRGRIAICGWNSRYWTFQEHCLSRDTVFQSGKGPRREFKGRYSTFLQRFKKESIHETLHRDLFHAARAIQIHTGAKRPCVTEERQSRTSKEESLFKEIWEALVDRNTTKLTDALGIFAALLGTDPTGILSLSIEDQMKAILASQSSLPLSILFTDAARHENSWIPVTPKGVVLDFTHMMSKNSERQGWRLPRAELATLTTSSRLVFLTSTQPQPGGWILDMNGEDSSALRADLEYKVVPHDPVVAENVLKGQSSVILIIQLSADSVSIGSKAGSGVCLLPVNFNAPVRKVRYGFPISWSQMDSAKHSEPQGALVKCSTELLSGNHGEIVLLCGKSSKSTYLFLIVFSQE
jgi:hypothetical protein